MGRLTALLLLLSAWVPSNGPLFAESNPPDTLIYTHLTHEKKYNVGKCETCHENILNSRRARDDNFADDMSCNVAGCHDIKDQATCHVCHTNAKGMSPVKPQREVVHSHKVHAKEGVECRECHKDIYDRTHFTREAIPDMLDCFPCHQEKRVSNKCDHCHSDPELALSHGIGWNKEHGEVAGRDQEFCGQCHTRYHCDRCHQGLEPLTVHGGNFLHLHQFDVFEDQTQCFTCHGGARYCNDCHSRSWGRLTDHIEHVRTSGSCKECH
ncbi:cytochrome c3 family protein [Fibrobacterota bacterium]